MAAPSPTDDVGVEEAAQDEVAVGEGAEDLAGGKRAVQEVPAAHGVEALAQERGQQHQMVVVHPHEVPVHVDHLHQLVREPFVGGQVPLPVDLVVPPGGTDTQIFPATSGHRHAF